MNGQCGCCNWPGGEGELSASPVCVLAFEINNEFRWYVRTPQIKTVFQWMILAYPVRGCRNIIDATGILAPASPRVPDVMKVVGSQHVAAGTPTFLVPLIRHRHGAKTYLIERRYDPAHMMEARPIRLRECNDVMIAAMDSVQKSDGICRTVGQSQTEHVRIKFNRRVNARREQ